MGKEFLAAEGPKDLNHFCSLALTKYNLRAIRDFGNAFLTVMYNVSDGRGQGRGGTAQLVLNLLGKSERDRSECVPNRLR